MSFGIRRNDQVLITAGKDRGKQGRVIRFEKKKNRVFVTRHLGHQHGVRQSGLTTQEAPLDMSNIRIVCPTCNKPSRVGTRILEDGSKVRICKACDEVLE